MKERKKIQYFHYFIPKYNLFFKNYRSLSIKVSFSKVEIIDFFREENIDVIKGDFPVKEINHVNNAEKIQMLREDILNYFPEGNRRYALFKQGKVELEEIISDNDLNNIKKEIPDYIYDKCYQNINRVVDDYILVDRRDFRE